MISGRLAATMSLRKLCAIVLAAHAGVAGAQTAPPPVTLQDLLGPPPASRGYLPNTGLPADAGANINTIQDPSQGRRPEGPPGLLFIQGSGIRLPQEVANPRPVEKDEAKEGSPEGGGGLGGPLRIR